MPLEGPAESLCRENLYTFEDDRGLSEDVDQSGAGVTQGHTACLGLRDQRPLSVHPEEGGVWSVVLTDRPANLVDVCSNDDVHTPRLWTGFSSHLQCSTGEEMKLPGGCYSCAQAIVERRLPFFKDHCLDHICRAACCVPKEIAGITAWRGSSPQRL